jgi:hypothetical protein
MISAKLVGGERLASKLVALVAAGQGVSLKPAVVAGALPIANKAKMLSPYKTGNNRRGIHVGGEGSLGGLEGGTTGTDIGGQEVSKTSITVLVGTNVEYARRLELGFAGTDALGRTYNQPARPYLRPAAESEKGVVVQEIADAARDLIRAAAR